MESKKITKRQLKKSRGKKKSRKVSKILSTL